MPEPSTRPPESRLSRSLIAAVSLLAVVKILIYDRLKRGYGSTSEERHQALPGDEIITQPHTVTTHAITIFALPAAIWPWLVQMGYHRGGWYVDSWWGSWLNNNIWRRTVPSEARGDHHPSANSILPAYQGLALSDRVPDGPEDSAYFTVTTLQPEEALVLFSTSHLRYLLPPILHETPLASHGDFSWTFVLQPLGAGRTRLIIRTRATLHPPIIRLLSMPMLHIADYLYTRSMLMGLKRRARS